MCQFLQVDLALAKESGERNEKMEAKTSKGMLLHIDRNGEEIMMGVIYGMRYVLYFIE